LPENFAPGLAGLVKRRADDLLVDAVNLQVELDSRDAPAGAGHLEIHVAVVVLIAHDVRQQDEAVRLLDQADGDARDRVGNRHPRVHERQRAAADAGHTTRPIRLQNIRYDANRVREFIRSWYYRLEAALGQGAVADFAPARSADRPAFAHA